MGAFGRWLASRIRRPITISSLVALSLLGSPRGEVQGSDHIDAPVTQLERFIDLGDLYAWHTPRGTIVVVLTYAPALLPGEASVYDDQVLYTICIDNTASAAEAFDLFDNDNDNACDIPILVRMGQDPAGNWGVLVENLPGAARPLSGPVEQVLEGGGGTRAMVGRFDDPFFYDFDGHVTTLGNIFDDADPFDLAFGTLVGGAPVDTFAGTDAMAIVLEFDQATAADGNTFLQIWATVGVL